FDPVHQRSRQSISIFLHLGRRAAALAAQIAEMPAGTRIHCGNKHELARKSERTGRARHRDFPVLERLAHYLQSGSMKFREFVQKKDSIMGKTHLSGSRLSGASQEAGVRNGVMRAPKRAG